MGAVYEAAMPDGQRVAVKVIRPELAGSSRSARRRFVREAQAVQSITNPHVVNVFHVDSDPELELPFIAMELLNGQDLDAVLERKGALDITACARLFVQACRGLSAAHAMGFVHRDVKPANLFLHELPNGEVVVKLCDFGVVKTGDSETDATKLTRTGGMLGSPMFMSPEQATNARAVDLRSDIWSLGASLYEAVGGQPPWPGCETVAQIIVAVSTRDVAPLQQHAPWVPPELCEVIHRTLRRDPADRYQSIDELAHALLPWSHGRVEIMRHELRADSRATAASRNVVFDNTVASVRTAGSVDQGSAATIATATPAARPRARRWPLAIGAALVIAIGGAAFAGLTLMRNDAESSRAPAAGEPREDDESKPAPAEPVTSADPKLAPPDVESSAPAPSASSTATKASPPRTSGSARPNAAPRPPASPKLPPPQPEKRPGAVDEWN